MSSRNTASARRNENQASLASISEEFLTALLCEKFNIPRLHPFQLTESMNLVLGRDVFLVSAPGSGKTLVMAAPFLAAQSLGQAGIGLVIVPTKILTEQQAQTFSRLGLRSLAINEDTLRFARLQKRDLWKELATGNDIRVAVMTPWMLSSPSIRSILGNKELIPLLRWLFVDEVHLFNEQDSVWRVVYQAIKFMRARLPSWTIWAAFTGTASALEASTIANGLGFRNDYISARYPVDRPNIKYIIRFCAHPMSGYEFYDVAHLIPYDMKVAEDIPITLVFCQTIDFGWRVMSFLDELIPPTVPDRLKLIKLCNAIFSPSYRQRFKNDMEAGRVRIGICTETCTYGVDIRNVRRVVSFGEIASYAKMKQALCRAGRDGEPAIAYTYAPSWVRDVPFYEIKGKQAKDDAVRREKLPAVIFDWFNASGSLLRTQRCPRQVDMEYNSETVSFPPQCCSFHHPNPEDDADNNVIMQHMAYRQARAPPKVTLPRSDGTFAVLEPHLKESLTAMLTDWRWTHWQGLASRREDCELPSSTLLPNHLLSRLVDKAHVCTTFENFERIVHGWQFLPSHGKKLFAFLAEVVKSFDVILGERRYEDSPASRPASPAAPPHEPLTNASNHPPILNEPTVLKPPPSVRLVVREPTEHVASTSVAVSTPSVSQKRQLPPLSPTPGSATASRKRSRS